MNNELYHWKYKSRKKVNGKWRYEYDTPKSSSNRNTKVTLTDNTGYKKTKVVNSNGDQVRRSYVTNKVPDAYKPNLKKSSYAGKNGYVNNEGIFFSGNYESARKQSYDWDIKQADSKAKSQLKEQQYRSSVKRHVDDVVKDAKRTAKKVSDFSQKQIDKGKSWLIKKLSK